MRKHVFANCVGYLAELWERDTNEEWNYHWKEIVGMNDEEMAEYQLVRKEV